MTDPDDGAEDLRLAADFTILGKVDSRFSRHSSTGMTRCA